MTRPPPPQLDEKSTLIVTTPESGETVKGQDQRQGDGWGLSDVLMLDQKAPPETRTIAAGRSIRREKKMRRTCLGQDPMETGRLVGQGAEGAGVGTAT